MTLLDPSEEPKSKTLRYTISGVALALALGLALFFAFRFNGEKRTIEHFMDAVVAGNFEQGYQIWKANGSYSYQDFLQDWGKQGYYGPIESYRIESATLLKDANGVIVVIEISPFRPFPANNDPQSGRNREVRLFVARSDQSLSFPP
jgi:hypothetical protein